jgi:hypothetical protein
VYKIQLVQKLQSDEFTNAMLSHIMTTMNFPILISDETISHMYGKAH